MRIAVTGGSGAIGSFVCDELGAAGYEPLSLDRMPPRVDVDYREVDLTSLDATREAVGAQTVYDVCHNIAKMETHQVDGRDQKVLVHRKGATRAFGPGDDRVPAAYRAVGQPVIVPGDMGRYSYVLAGTGRAMHETFGSACHGAGRLLSRTKAMKQAAGRRIDQELLKKGIQVMSKSRKTLAQEMSEAYKDVAEVVGVLEAEGIVETVARLVPVGVVKG